MKVINLLDFQFPFYLNFVKNFLSQMFILRKKKCIYFFYIHIKGESNIEEEKKKGKERDSEENNQVEREKEIEG